MNEAEAMALVSKRQKELLNDPEFRTKLKKIIVSEGKEAAQRFLLLNAVATLYGVEERRL